MEAIIEHSLIHGGHVQVAHGANCISLIVNSNYDQSVIGSVVLQPNEAIDLGLDLILQAKSSLMGR